MKTCTHSKAQAVLMFPRKDHQKTPKIWAGSRLQMEASAHLIQPDLVLNLCSTALGSKVTANPEAARLLSRYPVLVRQSFPTLTIDWPDGGIPPVGLDFWKDLIDFVREGHSLALYCLGGHGRTGTALVSLAFAGDLQNNIGNPDDLVEMIRETYCQSAVESSSQIAYLKALGVETKASGSNQVFNFNTPPQVKVHTKAWDSNTATYGECKSKDGKTYLMHVAAKGSDICSDCGAKIKKSSKGAN